MANTNEIISGNIRQLRKSKGMTQGDLAERLGYTVQAVSRWEKGKSLPDPVMLFTLAQLFEVDVSYFYSENHVEIAPAVEKGVQKRERLYRVAVVLSLFLILGLLATTIIMLIDRSFVHILLWILFFVALSVLLLGLLIKSRRIVKVVIPFILVTLFTAIYFSLKEDVPNLKFIFIPMAVLLVGYFVYLFLFTRKKI